MKQPLVLVETYSLHLLCLWHCACLVSFFLVSIHEAQKAEHVVQQSIGEMKMSSGMRVCKQKWNV